MMSVWRRLQESLRGRNYLNAGGGMHKGRSSIARLRSAAFDHAHWQKATPSSVRALIVLHSVAAARPSTGTTSSAQQARRVMTAILCHYSLRFTDDFDPDEWEKKTSEHIIRTVASFPILLGR